MSKIADYVYDLNYNMSKAIASVPYVGDELLGAVRLTCDYIIGSLVIGGTHAGCDAVNDVYSGLPENLRARKSAQVERIGK